jgi:hypothetical protein
MAEDALAPFADALVKAAKATPADTADPLVSAAFALGWQMAELYRPSSRRRTTKLDGDLPGLSSLSDEQRAAILVAQVKAGLTKLAPSIAQSGLPPVDLSALEAAVKKEGDVTLAAAVEKAHEDLLRTLTAANFRFGKAYGLGRALADTCRKPTNVTTFNEELEEHRIANLHGWLDDLSSAFPPHAAHSVASSLQRWVQWAAANEADAQANAGRDALGALRRQGELWRALLSAEKSGTGMLEIENYLDAARDLAHQMHIVLRGLIRRLPWLVGLAAALLLVGVGLLILGGSSEIVAGAGSIVAAIGLTWKGIGGALGQLAGKLEQPLWGAVLDDSIANAITLLPGNTHDNRERAKVALQMSTQPQPAAPAEPDRGA